MKEKIIKILVEKLRNENINCVHCRHNSTPNGGTSMACEECNLESMNWRIGNSLVSEIADKILLELKVGKNGTE